MTTHIVDFSYEAGQIQGLAVITVKQVSEERGTIRELFRRSAFEAAGFSGLDQISQVNVTESHHGSIRGMHAEHMTKMLTIAHGEAFGAFVDLRPDSETYGLVQTVDLLPGVQVLVPSGVANGFQSLTEASQYVYLFDAEWQPGMPGVACTPLDPTLAIPWPIDVDPDDPSQVSAKDRGAPLFADLEVVR